MKKGLAVCIALLAFVAFAGGAIAQEKKATPAPAAPKTAPAAEKAKAPAPPKERKAAGTVGAYEAGKMITLKGDKGKGMTFDITDRTKMKGEVKEGARVTVMYKKDGEKMVATSVTAPEPKKEKPAKPTKRVQ